MPFGYSADVPARSSIVFATSSHEKCFKSHRTRNSLNSALICGAFVLVDVYCVKSDCGIHWFQDRSELVCWCEILQNNSVGCVVESTNLNSSPAVMGLDLKVKWPLSALSHISEAFVFHAAAVFTKTTGLSNIFEFNIVNHIKPVCDSRECKSRSFEERRH